MPVRSCPFACRSGRPPAIPAPRTEPGSSPRQRIYNRHSQRSRGRSRYPQAGFARKIHLDHRRGAKPGIVPGLRISVSWRCNHHLRKPVTSAAKLLSPAVDLAWADLRPARHFGDNRSRLQGLGDNRLLLLVGPATPPLGAVITSTLAIAPPLTPVQAPSLALMLDYQPETVLRRKAALTGGKPYNLRADLDQLLAQAAQRPGLRRLWALQRNWRYWIAPRGPPDSHTPGRRSGLGRTTPFRGES